MEYICVRLPVIQNSEAKGGKSMKRSLSLVVCLCFLFFFAQISAAEEITNPILKKLVEKGILTKQEALSVMHDMEKESTEKDKKVEQKIEQKVSEATPTESKGLEKIEKALGGIKIGGLWYLSYGYGSTARSTTGTDVYNRFDIKRGYLTVEKEFFPWFQARITSDVTTVNDPTSNLDGSVTLRIKYIYGKFIAPDLAFLTKPNLEFGMVHIPWLDYEEHTNYYRMQDTMFLERNGIFNSSDIGLTFTSLLGGYMSEDYQKNVNGVYPGRYGSIQAGVYNGGGYHASEKNRNKVLEGRITLRPLPDIIPGLQFSYFGETGKGNTAAEPDWITNLAFGSFESEPVVVTGQYYWGTGQQNGANEFKKNGYSFFTELKLYNMIKDPINRFSVIGRFDHFDPDTHASDNSNNRYIAGVGYYLDKPHKNMILVDYDTVNYEQPGKSNDRRVQLTLQVEF
jgi:polyhydroxyalkanoate synthesis regulator phasin